MILYEDEEVTHRSARERNVGFVFQHYALFRHMNVFENVAFALRVRGWKQAKVRQRVGELLRLVRLDSFEQRRPSQLSGGQRQRVALAGAWPRSRACCCSTSRSARSTPRCARSCASGCAGCTTRSTAPAIFVTHDQEEAFEVADRVVVMNHGQIEQAGSPREVFERPASAFVMDFLGNVNVFHGRVQNGRALLGDAVVPCPDYPFGEALDAPSSTFGRTSWTSSRGSESPASLPAKVVHVNPAGSVARVQLLAEENDLALNVELSPERCEELDLKSGDRVYVAPLRPCVRAGLLDLERGDIRHGRSP